MIAYEKLLTAEKDWNAYKEGVRECFDSAFKMFPWIFGQNPHYVSEYMYREKGRKYEHYFYKQLPKYITYDGAAKLILDFYNLYINDSHIDSRDRQLAKKRWEPIGDRYLQTLRFLSHDDFEELEKDIFESIKEVKICTVELFRLGKLEDKDSELSAEMFAWLRESLNTIHPKTYLKTVKK